MKKFWLPILLVSFIFLLTGCSSRTQEVSTYDEGVEEELRERLDELEEMLAEKYDNRNQYGQDPDFAEYASLSSRSGQSRNSLTNTYADVDLNSQTIHYEETEIPYEIEGSQVVIPNNPTQLANDTLVRLVNLADEQQSEVVSHNRRVLLTQPWIPIILVVVGVIGLKNPGGLWYFSNGFGNKAVKPSDFAIGMVRIQSVIFFIIAAILVWRIYQMLI
ncbi:hypothetical protein HZY88_07825 [Aerococcaceae bacterium DSM 111176]|nr:hypothetical protein [Aerococcaceae bacterium DSM 111176]